MYPGVGTDWLAHFTKLEGISAAENILITEILV
jgi:hypothetical protein